MKTIYENRKRVTRMMARCTQGVAKVYPRCSQALAILMSMPRVWLEAAWSMARVWLEYAYSMPTVCLETKNLFPYGEQNIPTLGTKHSQPGNKTGFLRPFSSKRAELERRLVISLLLMLILGSGNVWGQTPDYSGTYYIKSVSTNNETTGEYYLCPTEGWAFFVSDETNPGTVQGDDNGKPFLTTYHCKNSDYDVTKAVWNIEKGPESGFYYIKQTKTGRYMVSNGPICSNANRARVHLEEINNPEDLDDKALFKIYLYNNEYLVIQPKGITTGSYKWLTVNQGNKDDLAGTSARTDGPSGFPNTGGIICIYSENDANAKFYLEKAKCKTPVITFDNVTSEVTITSDDDETIYYTTDGSDPDENSDEYSAPFELTEGAVIKAISKKDGIIDSEIATLTVVKLATPVITFNEETREVTITTTVEGAEIYYTTDDTDPTIEETTAHAESSIVIAHALPSTKIHAQAVKSGSINSDVVTKTDIPVRVLTNPTIILAEDEFVYDGSAKQPAITVQDGDVVVSADEYVVTYSNNTNAGTASVTISDKADGDYQVNDGSKNFTISPKSLGDGTTAAEGITVEITEEGSLSAVKDGSTTLVENTDYTQETVEEGSDKIITITGKGNYTGIAKGIYASPAFVDPDGGGSEQAAAVYMAKRDLSCPLGISPYIIRKVNPSIGTAVITKLDYIPEDVPVLLLSDDEASGFVASPKDPSTPDVTAQTKNSNLLKVSSGGETVGAAQIYMFYKGEFVLTKAGTLDEGKFFLYNPNYNAQAQTAGSNSEPAPSRGSLQIVFDDVSTGISELNNSKIEEKETDVWYTLDGRRLSVKPSKSGIYIHQGQKEYIKRK